MTGALSYVRPDTLSDALDLLACERYRIAAGCTDLFPATERKTLGGQVLDITGISALRGIQTTTDGVTIGACTTWTDLLHAELPPAFHGLKQSAREVGAKQIQNRGTLAGNLCNASPAADGVPPLLTLDAEVEIRFKGGGRCLPLSAFVTGPRKTVLKEGELVTAIHVPAPSMSGHGAFVKLGARAYLVISIAMTAVRITVQDELVTQAALAVGACGPVATRLPKVEVSLIGHPLSPDRVRADDIAEVLAPIDDMRADAAYRSESAAVLLRRALADLLPIDEVA